MTPERWDQIDRLFHAALDHEPGQRQAFVAHACDGDDALRKEIESLVSAHEQSADFIEKPAADVAADLFARTHAGLVAGLKLGPYRIVSLVGVGGMGEVYLADDTRLDRKVALKLLPPQFTVNPERVRRFEQEVRAASALNHPNIITIHDVGQWQGCDFIATEFIDGKTLRELIADEAMSVDEVLDIAIQLASALSAAHDARIVHRDIKPENIMVRRDGIVKVLDFGLAKLASEQLETASFEGTDSILHTNPGMIMGTAHYMSPEQARGDEVDARTDIWSLGAVVYEMLAGYPTFTGDTATQVTVSILHNEPLKFPQHRSAPAALERVVMKALSKDRESRYQTMNELLHDLQDVRRGQSSLLRRYKTTAVVMFAAIFIAAALVGVGLYRTLKERTAPFTNVQVTKVMIPRQIYSGCISRDGKYIAYVSLSTEHQGLWVKQVATDTDLQLVAGAPVSYWGIQISPDNEFVYYLIKNDNESALYRIPIAGGIPQRIIPGIGGFAFSPDGKRLAFKRGAGGARGEVQLITANADGSDEHVLMQRDGAPFWTFDWSPDSKSIAYINGVPRGEAVEWYVGEVPSAGGVERLITQPSNRRLRGLAWQREGEDLLLIADGEGFTDISQIWLLSLRDGTWKRITSDLNPYQTISVTSDGREILATMRGRPAKLWVKPTDNIRESRVLVPDVIGFDHIAWTPEGTLVAAETLSLWEINAESGERRRLTSDGWANYPVVTSDGRYVVYILGSSARLVNIWRMDRDGTHAVQLTTEGGTFPSVSTDGQWVYYTNPNYGHTGVWRVRVGGGAPERIVDAVAFNAAISPDGKLVAYSDEVPQTRKHEIVILPVGGGVPVKVFENTSVGYGNLRWTPDGRALVFINAKSADLEIFPLNGGPARKLLKHDAEELFAFDLSPDGKQLAYTKGTLTSTLVLISDVK